MTHTNTTPAQDAWEALIRGRAIRDGRGGIFVAEEPGGRRRASLWTLVNVIAAAADLAAMGIDARIDDLLTTLSRYRSGDAFRPAPGHRTRYFDDNAWLGLLSLRLFRRFGGDDHLRRASDVLRFVRRGETREGGVLWVEGSRSRNACSTAPGAELAVALHLHRPDPEAVAFADRSLAWLRQTLARDDGLIADHIDHDTVEPTVWSYNQGATAGAHRLLARTVDDPTASSVARRIEAASLELFDGERLWREPPPFLAVWFRELLAVEEGELRRAAQARLTSYLDRVTGEARDPRTGMFTGGGVGSYDGRSTIDQAAFVQLFALGVGVDPAPSGEP